MKTMTFPTAARTFAMTALLAGPILVSPAQAYGGACCRAPGWLLAIDYGNQAQTHAQSYWHTNMSDVSGVLVGLSRVAAQIQFNNGSKRIFSISHGSYERLRSYVGDFISFDVQHNVLHLN